MEDGAEGWRPGGGDAPPHTSCSDGGALQTADGGGPQPPLPPPPPVPARLEQPGRQQNVWMTCQRSVCDEGRRSPAHWAAGPSGAAAAISGGFRAQTACQLGCVGSRSRSFSAIGSVCISNRRRSFLQRSRAVVCTQQTGGTRSPHTCAAPLRPSNLHGCVQAAAEISVRTEDL